MEVAILGSPSLIVPLNMVPVDVKQHLKKKKKSLRRTEKKKKNLRRTEKKKKKKKKRSGKE